MQRLSVRANRFVDAYVRLGNGTKAAIEAGYKPANAGITACKLLKESRIQALLSESYKEYDLTREQYITQTIERAKNSKQESVQKGYWELVGKAKGFLSDNQTNVLVLNLDKDAIADRALSKITANNLPSHSQSITPKQVTETKSDNKCNVLSDHLIIQNEK